ncbi:TLD-domain-containing protein [Atractiella rhizophila]|nr:TLD-domain-containing protein [Atractiella rhizophila]
MDEDLADAIRPNLPGRSRLERDWTIVYSSEQHGISLHTLYNRVKSETRNDGQGNGLVLAVRDTSEHVFGAFVNEGFKLSRDYYGNGECFLWKAVPFDSKDFRVGSSVKCFRWTGHNDYMILSDSTMLSIGGGDGKFGLWVDSNFDKGFTATCPCFNNEVLCAVGSEAPSQSSFDILQMELWNIG